MTGSTTTSSGALAELNERAGQPLARVFYLSTAPRFFLLIAAKLGAAGLNRTAGAPVRIVIEKPFGYTSRPHAS